MVNTLVNLVWKTLLKVHENQINAFISDPHGTQKRELSKILTKASNTEWGQRYQFSKINSDKLLAKHIPIFEYDQIKDDIFRMMEGEKDVLWR